MCCSPAVPGPTCPLTIRRLTQCTAGSAPSQSGIFKRPAHDFAPADHRRAFRQASFKAADSDAQCTHSAGIGPAGASAVRGRAH
jgi:hypothetical protein